MPDKPPIITGGSKLLTITATAFPPGNLISPEHTRLITLDYDAFSESCTQSHSPVRLLTSIQESAWGADSPRVDLPAVTFEYGNPVALTSNVNQSAPWADTWAIPSRKKNLAWGYRRIDDRWPSLEAMLLDIDGDGLLDRVTSVGASTDTSNPISSCTAKWQRNLGPNAGGNIMFSGIFNTIALPRLKWRGTDNAHQVVAGAATAQRGSPSYEGCSLNGQVTAYQNSVPTSNCHPPTMNGSATDPNNHQHYCFDGGTELPTSGSPTSDYRTYLAYRWLDVDGDGLVDLVAAVHGDINAYDIERGNRINYDGGEPGISGIPGVGAWPACPGKGDRCTDFGSCLKGATSCTNGVCTPLWDVVNQCLVSQAKTGCAQVSFAPPPGGGGGGSAQNRVPYQRCEGLYPWLIYKNQGNGSFATTPIIKYQPVELESQASDSAVTGPAVAAENHAIIDFDGDGILDALVRDAINPSISWQVWLGDGTGGFGTKDYVYITRDGTNGDNRISSQGFAPTPMVSSSAGLIDINGDGLQDHWIPSASIFNVAISDGTQHRLYGTATPTGEIEAPANVKPGSDTDYTVTAFSGANVPLEGWSSAQNRVVDVDKDGRLDVVTFTPTPVVYWNAGGQFSSTSNPYPGINDDGIKRRTEATQTGDPPGSPETLYWELKGDLIDLDGNGIPESVFFTEAVLNRNKETTQPNTTAPPRLMIAIHNGRGGHAAVTYASMHDPAATVEQHPELRWTDAFCPITLACPKATSREQWVVKSMTVMDNFPLTQSITSYRYQNPRHSPDDRGRYGFRGFETVVTTAPSFATTEQTYGYDVDWSGRLTKTIVKPTPTESATDVRSIDKTTWKGRSLFGTAIKTYHATMSEHFTCANGQTEATCTPSAAPAYTRTTSTLTALASTTPGGGSPLLWQTTASLLQAGTAAADGDRQTVSTFALNADGSTYRLRPLTSTRQSRVLGTMSTFGKTAKTWDATYRVPLTDEVWVDNVDANRSIARSVYDMTTGNVTQHWKPKQNVAGTTSTTLTYDDRKLFVSTEINEVGHQRDYLYEYGTGTKLQTDGPNQRACVTGAGCQLDATHPLKEQRKIRVDGIGRPIENWQTLSDDGWFYSLYKLETNTYVDAAFPASTTNQVLLDVAGPVWKQQKTDLDGHGRPTKITVYAQGSAPNDQITSFVYRADGTLQSVSVPDPTTNNASVVTYNYGFDSLGRATSIRRPDSTTPASQSGVDIVYDGVTRSTTEVVGTAGGQPAMTKTINDSFGRLKEVDERTAITPLTFAQTVYAYGPDDNVATITAPQGVITTLIHDFADRRTKIARHGREWKYTYDANGNTIAKQVPGSTGPATDPLFTTTIVYDDLDRPKSKSIAPRNLTAADRALFVSGTEAYEWDTGPNHKGYLRYWSAFAPGTGTSKLRTSSLNDNQGRPTSIGHNATIAGYPPLSRGYATSWFAFGGVKRTAYRDFVGGTNQTEVDHLYDARGLPRSMRMNAPINQALAIQTRNVAGLVTKRRTNTTGAMTFVESNWTYDNLGRVTDQVVQQGPGATQVARQTLTYLGNDDPQTLQHSLGTNSRQFTYGYDLRHQLTGVATNASSYFGATYQYGLGGRFTSANETRTITPTPAGSNLAVRNVRYVHGDADPERVTALTNVSGGERYATYAYDAAGNQTWKCSGAIYTPICQGESFDYLYDGKDQLRRATRKVNNVIQGSEEYWYDGNGQRMLIVKRDAAGVKTELIWFIGDVEAHYDATGTVTKVYSHLSMGTPVARVERTGDTTTAIEYQFHGLASNTIAAVDQGGMINTSFSYAPFGEVIETTNAGGASAGAAAHKRRLNDKHEDDLTSLVYYGARYYDKTLIGWTQADPLYVRVPDIGQLSSPRRASIYKFSLNNPLRYMDPDGLDSSVRGPGPSLSSYKSEAEVRDYWRRSYENESNWEVSKNTCAYNSNRCSFILYQRSSFRVIDMSSPVFLGEGEKLKDAFTAYTVYSTIKRINTTTKRLHDDPSAKNVYRYVSLYLEEPLRLSKVGKPLVWLKRGIDWIVFWESDRDDDRDPLEEFGREQQQLKQLAIERREFKINQFKNDVCEEATTCALPYELPFGPIWMPWLQ